MPVLPKSPGGGLAGLWNLSAGFIAPWSVMPWWIRWFWCVCLPACRAHNALQRLLVLAIVQCRLQLMSSFSIC